MNLSRVKDTYEKFGRDDPFFAVLSVPRFKNNQGDREDFFATGREEIKNVLQLAEESGMTFPRGRALDFGCGVGRLSQALCEHFDEVVGVDIAQSMVDVAGQSNRYPERCSYVVNTADDLSIFDSQYFDFIYSNITLQHIPPQHSKKYIAEFFRILQPGGATIFQVPTGPDFRTGGVAEKWYRLRSEVLRPWLKRLRGKPMIQIHYIPRPHVEQIICQNSAELRLVDGPARKRLGGNYDEPYGVKGVRYFAQKFVS